MAEPTIYITARDYEKLWNTIHEARTMSEYRSSPYVQSLAKELERAVQVQSQEIPPDVITMNSQASLVDVDTGEDMVLTLVFPADAAIQEGKISILAPIGTAMLGYRVGDVFSWETPDGVRKLRVEKVIYQPESEGDYE